ncbi:MAG TPA: sigma-70 family RNA polymerase sigma factor [Pedobacter sp.]|uniref:RNA polymerase sigma factor n=1 Tax=Pedobacter sp. TaxID=1411316 RepID=UPI002BB8D58B|nr:sigma-70 family RNA polymerase sigma factor [Pedobacter sp.]HMI01043.1 sigma-70 family RNA polymerase sigma factor [Pedobacter sp.]
MMISVLSECEEDEQLLTQLREGDKSAFDKIYLKYWKVVLGATYKRVKDMDKSEDIAQDIFTRLWIRRDENNIKNLRGYLLTAVRNGFFTLMTKENRFISIDEISAELQADASGADGNLLFKELMNAYEAMIEDLPNQQKAIFRMRYQQELSTDEIAQQLELSPKTVRNHLGRAINTLRTAITLAIIMMTIGQS